jgi:rhamnosyltransferase
LKKLETAPALKIIFNAENTGIAVALNTGIEEAKKLKAEWVLTLDHDSELLPDSLPKAMSDFASLGKGIKEKCGIIALKYIERDIMKPPETLSPDVFKKLSYAMTSGNLTRMDVLEKAGRFEEKLFIDQVDNDMDFRIRKAGYVILEAQNNYILHELGESEKVLGFTIRNYSPVRRYYLCRNCVYILKKYFFSFPLNTARIAGGSILGGLFKVILFEKQKLQKIRFTVEGVFDGIFNRYGKKHNP